jgi:hypothetical protein
MLPDFQTAIGRGREAGTFPFDPAQCERRRTGGMSHHMMSTTMSASLFGDLAVFS